MCFGRCTPTLSHNESGSRSGCQRNEDALPSDFVGGVWIREITGVGGRNLDIAGA
jgi:hypothetical protein